MYDIPTYENKIPRKLISMCSEPPLKITKVVYSLSTCITGETYWNIGYSHENSIYVLTWVYLQRIMPWCVLGNVANYFITYSSAKVWNNLSITF